MEKIICPHCGREIVLNENNTQQEQPQPQPQKRKKKTYTGLIVSFILAATLCGVGYYYFSQKQEDKEREAYEYAMKSGDPMVLQSFLDTYGAEAPMEHLDSIRQHIQDIRQVEQDWTNALVNGTSSALASYLEKYPNSPHRREAAHKIDSLDWEAAKAANTMESYKDYLDAHRDGDYYDEAETAIKALKAQEVTPEEKDQVAALFRRFFQSVNARNEEGMLATVEDELTSFLGKELATKSDVSHFLQKIYKEDITNMNWHINPDYNIEKREVGDEQYEYTVTFTARQEIERTDETKEKTALYRINAKVSPEGKISEMNITKLLR